MKDQNTGIISTAIANAEKIPHPEGQENLSLLHQKSKPSPVSSQFTFTCDSQVPGSTPWPGSDPALSMGSAHGASQSSQAAQAGYGSQGSPAAHDGYHQDPRSTEGSHPQPAAPPKKPENIDRELREQARARRRNARFQNKHHPPKPEDVWVCDFCIYEDIYGSPPRHLIRDFELKERKQRLQEAALKRKMEKMKKDARKGKRGGRLAPPHDHAAHDRNLPPHDHHAPVDNYESEVDDEEYENDEYDDEGVYSPDEPPPLEPDPQAYHHPPPIGQGHRHQGITAGGAGGS